MEMKRNRFFRVKDNQRITAIIDCPQHFLERKNVMKMEVLVGKIIIIIVDILGDPERCYTQLIALD